jgi:PhzF family phenazine biosynthesis protein
VNFAVYDVFCDEPYSGNQAAVVRTEGPLTSDRLLILAKEFNLPETCAYWMSNGAPHMIFATSDNPIDACGHGLLAVLADVVRTNVLTTLQNLTYHVETCGSGLWRFTGCGQRSAYVSAKWPKLPTLSKVLPVAETAQLLDISVKSIREDLPLAAFNSGIINGVVPLVDEQELTALELDFGRHMEDYFAKYALDDRELYCVTEGQISK